MTIGYPLMKTCTQFIGVSELLEIPVIEISDLIVMQLNYIINYCHYLVMYLIILIIATCVMLQVS